MIFLNLLNEIGLSDEGPAHSGQGRQYPLSLRFGLWSLLRADCPLLKIFGENLVNLGPKSAILRAKIYSYPVPPWNFGKIGPQLNPDPY